MNARIHIFVYGVVQGVFFRSNTVSAAKRLGLRGWVRNMRDGSVEIVAEGEKELLEKLAEWCREGPEGAEVENMKKEWERFTGEFSDFEARPTA